MKSSWNFTENSSDTCQDGDIYYVQKVGIAQGSILSPLLCSLFYSHLEHHNLRGRIALNHLDVQKHAGQYSTEFSSSFLWNFEGCTPVSQGCGWGPIIATPNRNILATISAKNRWEFWQMSKCHKFWWNFRENSNSGSAGLTPEWENSKFSWKFWNFQEKS